MHQSNVRSGPAFVVSAVLVMGLLAGCGGDKPTPNPNLADPKTTVKTYVFVANELAAAHQIDLGKVKEGLQCFSQADRDWFKKNYETFPLDELAGNAVMAVSEPPIKAAMIFTYGVVMSGPLKDVRDIEVVSQTETEATVKVDNYFTIPLVKEGPNWRIKGLFGATANKPHEPSESE